jgi:hypothetical protein
LEPGDRCHSLHLHERRNDIVETADLKESRAVNGVYKPEVVLPPDAVASVPGDTAKPLAPLPVAGTYTPHTWADVAYRAQDGAAAFGRLFWRFVKLGICIGLDIFDGIFGRLLGFGIAVDVGCALICAALWGKRGWWALWEVADITEQLDAFIPTCTIIALRSWNDN